MRKTFHIITQQGFGEHIPKKVCVSVINAFKVSVSVDGKTKHFDGETAHTDARCWVNDKIQGFGCTVNYNELASDGFFSWEYMHKSKITW